jgi:hypothetical protein
MQQIKLCLKRGFWRLKADPSLTFFQLFGNSAMALILGSVFYNMGTWIASYVSNGDTDLLSRDYRYIPIARCYALLRCLA